MYFGHMVEMEESEELFAYPLHGYTKALLSAIPLPDPYTEKRRRRIFYERPTYTSEEEEKFELREIYPSHFVRCAVKGKTFNETCIMDSCIGLWSYHYGTFFALAGDRQCRDYVGLYQNAQQFRAACRSNSCRDRRACLGIGRAFFRRHTLCCDLAF